MHNDSFAAIVAELSTLCGAAADDAVSGMRSYWYHGKEPNFPPSKVSRPNEWTGGDRLNVVCTQTDLSATAQRKLVDEWCEVLPELSGISHLWLSSRVPQKLFDAACRLHGLQGLYLKWNAISDLAGLHAQTQLQYLHLGDSASVQSLDPLTALKSLKCLEIAAPSKACTLHPLGKLDGLDGLAFIGREGRKLTVESLEPLSALTDLSWLNLGALHVADLSLRPLASLTKLRSLNLGNFFSTEEFAWLSARLPNTQCSWLNPFEKYHRSVFPCQKCKANWRVMTSGKPGKNLCPSCETLKLARHVQAFRTAADGARNDQGTKDG